VAVFLAPEEFDFMVTVIAAVHVIFCLLLIALVLLQDPKSGGAGGMFGGGGSGSILGATGAVTFLTRLTRYSAIVFGITCLILTLFSRPQAGSVLDSVPAGAAAPAAPMELAPGASGSDVAPTPEQNSAQ
jgi:preprotein translocase subunit SecG